MRTAISRVTISFRSVRTLVRSLARSSFLVASFAANTRPFQFSRAIALLVVVARGRELAFLVSLTCERCRSPASSNIHRQTPIREEDAAGQETAAMAAVCTGPGVPCACQTNLSIALNPPYARAHDLATRKRSLLRYYCRSPGVCWLGIRGARIRTFREEAREYRRRERDDAREPSEPVYREGLTGWVVWSAAAGSVVYATARRDSRPLGGLTPESAALGSPRLASAVLGPSNLNELLYGSRPNEVSRGFPFLLPPPLHRYLSIYLVSSGNDSSLSALLLDEAVDERRHYPRDEKRKRAA